MAQKQERHVTWFLDDNARPHRNASVKAWIEEKEICRWHQPALSTDTVHPIYPHEKRFPVLEFCAYLRKDHTNLSVTPLCSRFTRNQSNEFKTTYFHKFLNNLRT